MSINKAVDSATNHESYHIDMMQIHEVVMAEKMLPIDQNVWFGILIYAVCVAQK